MDAVKSKMARAGFVLPKYTPPAYAYQSVTVHKDVAYVSGHVPKTDTGDLHPGKVGAEVSVEDGKYPPAKPGALGCEPLKAVRWVADRGP
jgi:hypothetical protein